MSYILDFRYYYLPYCIQKVDNNKHVVLNRAYKPVGFVTTEYIKYEDFPVSSILSGITKSLAKRLSIDKSDNVDMIYLYDDANNPLIDNKNMKSYLKKIATLSKLTVVG